MSSLTTDMKPLPGQVSTIAFGSCNHQDKDQPFWETIAADQPDLWIWLGDNIYADTEDSLEMQADYARQLQKPPYRNFIRETPVIGIWDDHDYGVNDGGRNYPERTMSKALLMDFLGVPEGHPRRQREGAYGSYTFGAEGRMLKVILLDTRYFREALKPNPDGPTNYKPNDGSLLGEAQWQWLEEELQTDARLVILGSSIQVLSPDHRFEKWNNFPQARARLLDMLRKSGLNLLVLSGDRHISEFSILESGFDYPLVDFTSSGLTHAWTGEGTEANPLRHGPLIKARNYGLIEIDWNADPLSVRLQSKDLNGGVHHQLRFSYPE